jgi:tetraacyldisaccharide 4'-kinase
MAGRHGDTHRLIRWLWTSRRLDARLVRLGLLPTAALWRAGMDLRELSFRRGWRASHALPLPSVAVGNLTVGGSGKTPLAAWIARHYAARGRRPGILLRGYGADEVLVHRHDVPDAIVVANPDRVAGAAIAVAGGADVLVLDDAFQRLDVLRDLNVLVVSAETTLAVRWPLPAGPWREGWGAMARADVVVVTRKRATTEAAARLAEDIRRRTSLPTSIVHLGLHHLEGLVSGRRQPIESLRGQRVVAATAIADPDAFVAQIKGTGAQVQVATWRDHHDFRDEDVAWLARAARKADHVVLTAKDAVKLRDRWPASAPEPLVAILQVQFEAGGEAFIAALDALGVPLKRPQSPRRSGSPGEDYEQR